MYVTRRILAVLAIATFALIDGPNLVGQIVNEARLPDNATRQEAQFITDIHTLTNSGGGAGEGYFSPDGRFMVFQSERIIGNPFYQIYRMDMENGQTKLISPGHGRTTCAWIHPKNGNIIFSSTHEDPDAYIKQTKEIIKRETSTERMYSWSYDAHYDIYRWDSESGEYTNLTKSAGYDAEASYSPDGEWICFASNRQVYGRMLSSEEIEKLDESPEYFMELYMMKADGSEVKRLTDHAGYDGGPFFSADGSKICWRRFNAAGTLAEIWTMNVDGSNKKQLTRMNAMSWAPFFHPSGKYLIFTTNRHGYSNFELYLVDAEGLAPPRRVTYSKGFDGLPVFTPDGSQLVWSSERNADAGDRINSSRKLGSQLERGNWNHEAALKSLGISPEQSADTQNTSVQDKASPKESIQIGQENASATSPDYDEQDVFRHVAYLCDPELKGRMTGTAGERKATGYVAAYLDALGVKPAGDNGSWFQKFDYPAGAELGSDCRLSVDGEALALDVDWRPLTLSQAGKVEPAEVVFGGYGIVAEKDDENSAYNSYVHLDVKDKWVMVFRHLPEDASDKLRQFLSIHANLAKKAMELRDLGARGMIVVSGPNSHFKDKLIPLKNDFTRGSTSLAAITVSDELASKWLKMAGKDLQELQTQLDSGDQMMGFSIPGLKIAANIDIKQNRGIGQNVVGRLQFGERPSDQVIVIGAHVDHLGEGRSSSSLASARDTTLIHYGADDNASGVAAMLEVAEYLANLKRNGKASELKRDVIFAAWSGEELGLHGSNHFVKSLQQQWKVDPHGANPHGANPHGANPHGANPHGADPHGADPNGADPHASSGQPAGIYPRVAAYLNMDMVGRYNGKLQLQGLGSSNDWGSVIETANFNLRFKIAKVQDTNLPTDATGFYKAGVPILAAFTGSHSDYHTPRDTPDKIKYPETAKIANLIGNMAISLSQRDAPLQYQQHDSSTTSRGGGVMGVVYLGTHPDYAFEGKGVRLTGVTENSPSEKAGLGNGDVIIELGGKKVESVQEYMYAIGALKIGRETTVVVLREEKPVTLKITPGVKE